jgi:hypothetical protein
VEALTIVPADSTGETATALMEEVATSPSGEVEAAVPCPGRPGPRSDQFAEAVVLAALLAIPALLCVHAARINDPDIWWHMRTGEWIVSHHAVPRVDLFSRFGAGRPWAAYTWLFDLLSFGVFRRFGMAGIVGYSAGMVLAITVAVEHLLKRLQSDFSLVALLTFGTCVSIAPLFTPRPWMFSILFFALEMDILMHARKTGRVRELAWLPVLFALWSNLHIQFVDGLVMLGLAAAEALVAGWGVGERTRLRLGWAAAGLAGSAAATLANPFGWHIYGVARDLAGQPGVMDRIAELKAMRFRDPCDFCILFLAMASAAVLGRGRRLRLFETGMLVFAAIVSFRSERDVWVMATVSAAILASALGDRGRVAVRLPGWATMLAIAGAGLAVLGGFRGMGVSNERLESAVAKSLPVRAVEAIRAQGWAGPVFNGFDWGGYLIWGLRMPVTIDGRAAFYGDAAIDRSVATWSAEPDWADDSALMSAGLVVGPVEAPLTQVLRLDGRFGLVYQDDVAAVFVRRR